MTLKKNDIVNLTITSATAEGSGVGRTDDGIAVFVQGSAIGDELNVRILKVKKTYAFGFCPSKYTSFKFSFSSNK